MRVGNTMGRLNSPCNPCINIHSPNPNGVCTPHGASLPALYPNCGGIPHPIPYTAGLLEKSKIDNATVGATILSSSDAFYTILNIPSNDTKKFTLPTPSSEQAGYWYAICNRSPDHTIDVEYPPGIRIATIPRAPNGDNGGSTAKFAVFTTGDSYIRVS